MTNGMATLIVMAVVAHCLPINPNDDLGGGGHAPPLPAGADPNDAFDPNGYMGPVYWMTRTAPPTSSTTSEVTTTTSEATTTNTTPTTPTTSGVTSTTAPSTSSDTKTSPTTPTSSGSTASSTEDPLQGGGKAPAKIFDEKLPDGRFIKDLPVANDIYKGTSDFSKIVGNKDLLYVISAVQKPGNEHLIYNPFTIGAVLGFLFEKSEFGGPPPGGKFTIERLGLGVPPLLNPPNPPVGRRRRQHNDTPKFRHARFLVFSKKQAAPPSK